MIDPETLLEQIDTDAHEAINRELDKMAESLRQANHSDLSISAALAVAHVHLVERHLSEMARVERDVTGARQH